jgi:hypothetical protein
VEEKVQIWEKMRKGFSDLDLFLMEATAFSERGRILRREFLNDIKSFKHDS